VHSTCTATHSWHAARLKARTRLATLLTWTERDQRVFAALTGLVAVVNRLLPSPISRFPFNTCLQGLRIRRLVRGDLAA
jgi:uncharacterized protein (DUF2236 family)